MPKRTNAARKHAETQFDKARKTTEVAQGLIESELAKTRAKTRRLKTARLAQEADDAAKQPDKKKPTKKAKAKKKA